MRRKIQNWLKRSGRATGVVALAVAGGLVVSVAQASTYDFEQLMAPQTIDGQDGWTAEAAVGDILVTVDPIWGNGTQVVRPIIGVASGWFSYVTRTNNDGFGFSPFFGTESLAITQFDVNGAAAGGFALGHDVDGNGLLDREREDVQLPCGEGEVGPVIWTIRDEFQGVEQFGIQRANQGTLHVTPLNTDESCSDPELADPSCNKPEDWYRLQLRMDFTANNGDGSGSLYYKNLSRGDTSFQPVDGLQDVALELQCMHPDARPQSWDAMWMSMRFDGRQHVPVIDNLVPHVSAVLQDDWSLSVEAVDAGNYDGDKYDAVLEPVLNPTDSNEFCWQLKQVRIADPATPSTNVLDSNLDLTFGQVDVLQKLSVRQTLYDVRLTFMEPWRWCYVPDDAQ
jgi:hypothetical protein